MRQAWGDLDRVDGKEGPLLRRVVDELSLTGTEVVDARVEDASRMVEHRGMYDVATARAVARLSVLAEYCVPLLNGGVGSLHEGALAGRGALGGRERAAEKLGARVSELIRCLTCRRWGRRNDVSW